MKKLIWLGLWIAFITSCKTRSILGRNVDPFYALSGQVLHPETIDTIYIAREFVADPMFERRRLPSLYTKIPVDSLGHFIDSFKVEEPAIIPVFMKSNWTNLYLTPTGDIEIIITPRMDKEIKGDSMVLRGSLTRINQYLYDQKEYVQSLHRKKLSGDTVFVLQKSYFKDWWENKEVDSLFAELEVFRIYAYWLEQKLFNRISKPKEMWDLEDPYYDFVDSIDFNHPFGSKYHVFVAAMSYLSRMKAWQLVNGGTYDDENLAAYHFIRDTFENPLKNALLVRPIFHYLDQHGINEISDSLFTNYLKSDASLEDKMALEGIHTSLVGLGGKFPIKPKPKERKPIPDKDTIEKSHLSMKARPAPNFRAINLKGDTVSLYEFRGNPVLVDVWATWCKPCIESFPKIVKLQEAFQGQENAPEIIFLSVNRKQESWKRFISERNDLQGIHLNMTGVLQDEFSDAYAMYYIPTYILIDANGSIVSRKLIDLSYENINALLE